MSSATTEAYEPDGSVGITLTASSAGARNALAYSTIFPEPMARRVSSYNNESPNTGIGGMTSI